MEGLKDWRIKFETDQAPILTLGLPKSMYQEVPAITWLLTSVSYDNYSVDGLQVTSYYYYGAINGACFSNVISFI